MNPADPTVTVAQLEAPSTASIYPSNADEFSGLSGDLKWSLASSTPDPRVGAASVTIGAVASICRHRVTRPAYGAVDLAPRRPRPPRSGLELRMINLPQICNYHAIAKHGDSVSSIQACLPDMSPEYDLCACSGLDAQQRAAPASWHAFDLTSKCWTWRDRDCAVAWKPPSLCASVVSRFCLSASWKLRI